MSFIIKLSKGTYHADKKTVSTTTLAKPYASKEIAVKVLSRIKNSSPRKSFSGAYVVQISDGVDTNA